jgi:hypothetical protein
MCILSESSKDLVGKKSIWSPSTVSILVAPAVLASCLKSLDTLLLSSSALRTIATRFTLLWRHHRLVGVEVLQVTDGRKKSLLCRGESRWVLSLLF